MQVKEKSQYITPTKNAKKRVQIVEDAMNDDCKVSMHGDVSILFDDSNAKVVGSQNYADYGQGAQNVGQSPGR